MLLGGHMSQSKASREYRVTKGGSQQPSLTQLCRVQGQTLTRQVDPVRLQFSWHFSVFFLTG